MKLKIKVKVLTKGCMPEISTKGDWIDLRSAVDMCLPAPQAGTLKKKSVGGVENGYRNVVLDVYHIPLGVSIELPKGFEAHILPRSSSPSKFKLFIPNGQGIIDNTYNGDNDEWNFICSTMNTSHIHKGDRICQFRIVLSQHATFRQKLKWLLCSGIKIKEVKTTGNPDRGGIGSTGIK